jgi:hypothetical protein
MEVLFKKLHKTWGVLYIRLLNEKLGMILCKISSFWISNFTTAFSYYKYA